MLGLTTGLISVTISSLISPTTSSTLLSSLISLFKSYMHWGWPPPPSNPPKTALSGPFRAVFGFIPQKNKLLFYESTVLDF